MLSSQRTEFINAETLDVAPPRVKCEYCRIVGLEYRGPVDDKADPDVLLSLKQQQMEAIVAYCPEGGTETVIQSVQIDLDTNRVGHRQHLMTLTGFRNITHATLSSHGSNEEVILCYTEIVGGRTTFGFTGGSSAAFSSGGSVPSSSFASNNGGMGNSVNSGPNFDYSTNGEPIVGDGASVSSRTGGGADRAGGIPTFKMTMHVVGTNLTRDITSVSSQELSNHLKGYRSNNICQRAYFLRQNKPKSQLYMLVAYDYVALAIYQVGHKGSKGFEFNPVGQGLAGRHLWHHWCPLTQRVSFWVYRQTYELRVMKISSSGVPTPIFQMADSRRGKVDPIPFSPPPNPCLPWGSGNSSLSANFAITMLPIVYESAGDKPMRDIAMCYQKLVSVAGRGSNTTSSLAYTVQSNSQKVSIHCSIYLLQNWLHNISLVFDIDTANVPVTACLRASFVYLEGLIAIIIPGVFIHFVDVAHYDQAPRYMFGLDLLAHRAAEQRELSRASAFAHTVAAAETTMSNSAAIPITSVASPTGNGASASFTNSGRQVSTGSISSASGPSPTLLVGTMPASASANVMSPLQANASGMFSNGSGSPLAQHSTALQSHILTFVASAFADFSPQSHPLVPHRSGSWVLSTDSTRLLKITLSKTNLWRWIRDGTGGVERFGVHNAIHIATTHFDGMCSGHGHGGGGSEAANGRFNHSSVVHSDSERFGIKTVTELLDEDRHTSVTPSFLCQVLIGETYNEVRRVCRSKQNPYWHHVPMSDDHGLAELEEIKMNHRQVSAVADRPNRAWVRDICKRTNDDWWLQGDDVRRPFIFGLLKKKTVTTLNRFSLTGGIVRTTQSHSYHESIKRILLDLEVPKDSADFIATIYTKTLDGIVKALLTLDSRNITPPKKLHFLHNVKVALLALDFPAPDYFERHYTELALQLMPPSAIYESVRGKLITPNIKGLFKHYDCLQERANDAARDTGFPSQHLPIMSISSYDRDGGSGAASKTYPGCPTEKELAYALEGLEELCPSVLSGHEYALDVTSSAAVASTGITPDEKHALVAAIQPEPLLQSYRRHFPLDTTFGRYLPLNLFVESPVARESRLVAYNESELHVKRERAQLVMQEALYPMLVEPVNNTSPQFSKANSPHFRM